MVCSIASVAQTADTLSAEQLKSKILSMQNDIVSLKMSVSHSMDAGFELQSASKEHFTATLICIVGAGISTLCTLAPKPYETGMAVGGVVCLVGVVGYISSWVHIYRAGRLMQRKKE